VTPERSARQTAEEVYDMESPMLDIAAVAHKEIAATPEFANMPNKGSQFVAWYLHRAHGVDPLAAVDAVTDGPDDKQIDGVFIDDECARVLIIQGKFYEGGTVTGEAVGECLRAIQGLKNLPDLQQAANSRLAVKIPDIQAALQNEYTITVELVTIGDIATNARQDIHSCQQKLSTNGLSIEIIPVDGKVLLDRYCQATQRALPKINHEFDLSAAQWGDPQVNDTRCLLVVMPLTQAITIPGVDNGMLFRKNVRQALGKGTRVNRGLRTTLQSDEIRDFFFYHNGITAICDSFVLDPERRTLTVKGINVVNGCQSLTTLLQNSEAIREHDCGYVLWRFYEISDHSRADKISTFTNSQNAVSSRDLASNDTVQLLLKQRIEGAYKDIYFATKRGEVAPAGKRLLDSALFAKLTVSWDHWMPYRAHSEQNLFDRYYPRLFHSQIEPEDVIPVFDTFDRLRSLWTTDLRIRDELRSKTYHTPYHVLTAMGLFLAAANPSLKGMPKGRVLQFAPIAEQRDTLLQLACNCVQQAFEKAADAADSEGGFLAIENWLKSRDAVRGAREMAKVTYGVLSTTSAAGLAQAVKLLPEMFHLPVDGED
jgi:hypothetical protein